MREEIAGIDMVLVGQRVCGLDVAVRVLYHGAGGKFRFTYDSPSGAYFSGEYTAQELDAMRRDARDMVQRDYGAVHTRVEPLKEISHDPRRNSGAYN